MGWLAMKPLVQALRSAKPAAMDTLYSAFSINPRY
jgi:hypothetical protein